MFTCIRNNDKVRFATKQAAIDYALKRADLYHELWDIIGDDGHTLKGFGG